MRFFKGRWFKTLLVLVVGVVCMMGCAPHLQNHDDSTKYLDEFTTGDGGEPNKCGKDGTAGSCKTVVIGGRTWMAQNLNYNTSSSWCYKFDTSYCNKYGRLYTWHDAINVCPAGYHLPSSEEWDGLKTADTLVGKKLKTKSG